MFKNLTIFSMADQLAQHSSARQNEIARNVANADTPGFRAGDISPFSEVYRDGPGFELSRSRADHFMADQNDAWRRIDAPNGQSPNGNTVSLEDQMLIAAEVRQSHDMALSVYSTSMSILRSSLGGR